MCWHCGSLERDRLVWLFLDRNVDLITPGMAILHVAPESALRPRLERIAGRYVCGDLTGEFGDHRIDVTSLPFPDGTFDAVVCNHVLEHVPDDRTAMRELRRVLRCGGWGLLLVPDVTEAHTTEDPSNTDQSERRRRFGQEDHVRKYGLDYVDRLAAAGFEPEMIDFGPKLSSPEIRRHRLQKFGQLEPIFFCR
jgi:SAM-dependent methyltransferase